MKTMKRILALLFALILVLSLLPAVAMADTSTWTFTMNDSSIPSTATNINNGMSGTNRKTYTSIEDMVTRNELPYNKDYCFVVELECTDHTGTQGTDRAYFSVLADKPGVKVLLATVNSEQVSTAQRQWATPGTNTNQSSNPFTVPTADREAWFWWCRFYDSTYSQDKPKLFVAVDPTTVTTETTLTINSFNKKDDGKGAAGDNFASFSKTLPAYTAPAADAVTVGDGETLNVTAGAASTNNGTTTSEVSVAVDNDPKATVSTSGVEVNSTNVDVASVVTGLVEDGKIRNGSNSVVFTLDKQPQAGATETSATYDVVPKLSVNEGEPVVVSNAQLTGPVTFKLRAPAGASEGDLVTAVHTYAADAEANITAGSETFKNLPVDTEGNVTLTLSHFSEVTLTLQNGAEPDAIIRSMNGYLADYFVLNFYVTTDVQNPRFAFNRAYDSKTLQQVNTKAEFCESNVAVYYVEYVQKGGANALGLKSTSTVEPGTYMVSVKFFTKFLDQTVTLSMTDANGRELNIQGYGYTNGGTTIGTSEVATSHSYSFTDFLHIMKLYQGGGYENLYNGLSAAAQGARSIETA